MKFQIEQVALFPSDSKQAMALLKDLGMTEWVRDTVTAHGAVNGSCVYRSVGELAFNYTGLEKARELEVLSYQYGPHWMQGKEHAVSHLGMHCTEEELARWRTFFDKRGIDVAQELNTVDHTNEAIRNQRWYHYVIFNTRSILGVDLKFIVRNHGTLIECLVCGSQHQAEAGWSSGQARCRSCCDTTNHIQVKTDE